MESDFTLIRKLTYLNIICFSVAFGCNGASDHTTKHHVFKPPKDSLSIIYHKKQVNSKLSNFDIFDVARVDQVEYLLFYSKASDLIEIVKLLDGSSVYNKSVLPFLGDIQVYDEVNSIEFVNFDSIFILQGTLLSLIDTSTILWQKPVNTEHQAYTSRLMLMNMNHSPIYFDRKPNRLSIQSYCHTCYFYDKKYYQTPISVSLNLDEMTIEQHNIHFPKAYLQNYYGFNNLIFRNEYEDRVLLSFSAEPDLTVYDKESLLVRTFNGRSRYQYRDIKPLPKKFKKESDKKLKHLTLQPLYKEFLYDHYRGLYYRFMLTGLDEKRADDTYSIWEDKELILMIFDLEFNILHEMNLGANTYNSSKSFVGPEGLYLFNFAKKQSQDDSTTYHYDILEIN
jgi:hypothetical protein